MKAKSLFLTGLKSEMIRNAAGGIQYNKRKITRTLALLLVFAFFQLFLSSTPLLHEMWFKLISLFGYAAFTLSFLSLNAKSTFLEKILSDLIDNNWSGFSEKYSTYHGRKVDLNSYYMDNPADNELLYTLKTESDPVLFSELMKADRGDITYDYICELYNF